MAQKNNFVLHVLIGIAIIALLAYFFIFISSNPSFFNDVIQQYRLIGLFVAAIIANATIFLPVPLDVIVIFLGANPHLVGLEPAFHNYVIMAVIVGLGAAIGELSAYILGLQGSNIAARFGKEQVEKIEQIKSRLGRGGTVVIFLGALVPFPFDFIGLAAGLVKFPPERFFAAVFAGKTIKHFIAIMAGALGIEILKAVFGI
ncbi:MAG TPA: VTT domain-containing protein [Candidatus Diapherotrites archaeon]|uniref:VTT domain-containing protein n=1 Tax=Candidatus Iainarchaeum sp. TaxID=3101447 RepID=A0A7J4J190_9ARCH|nr:VTT domain-containing protein [Candidatus Diapherotrites archaeon]